MNVWPCHANRRCRSARSDLGERWSSRLVAAAAENRLSFRRVVCGNQRLPNNRDL
jgi:hypothetical protein